MKKTTRAHHHGDRPSQVTALPKLEARSPPSPIEEDFEDGLTLPEDLTQLSLRPLSLLHRTSKSSFEWGDSNQTSSSQSSDAYSTLGFADNSPSSNYTSASLPETETEDEDEDDGDLDGLVIPSGPPSPARAPANSARCSS